MTKPGRGSVVAPQESREPRRSLSSATTLAQPAGPDSPGIQDSVSIPSSRPSGSGSFGETHRSKMPQQRVHRRGPPASRPADAPIGDHDTVHHEQRKTSSTTACGHSDAAKPTTRSESKRRSSASGSQRHSHQSMIYEVEADAGDPTRISRLGRHPDGLRGTGLSGTEWPRPPPVDRYCPRRWACRLGPDLRESHGDAHEQWRRPCGGILPLLVGRGRVWFRQRGHVACAADAGCGDAPGQRSSGRLAQLGALAPVHGAGPGRWSLGRSRAPKARDDGDRSHQGVLLALIPLAWALGLLAFPLLLVLVVFVRHSFADQRRCLDVVYATSGVTHTPPARACPAGRRRCGGTDGRPGGGWCADQGDRCAAGGACRRRHHVIQLRLSPFALGLVLAVGGVGALTGATLSTAVGNRLGTGGAIICSYAVSAVGP